MYLPKLSPVRQVQSTMKNFMGYDHTEACGEEWFYHEENLSGRSWPVLRPRLPRTRVQTLTKPHGLYAKNGLLWVDGTRLFYNGKDVGAVSDTDKQFCGLGSLVLIWPDKLAFDTAALTLKPLGAKWQATGNVTVSPALENGDSCTISHTGATPPEKPANGDFWLDTGGTASVLRVYSAATESWGAVPTTYVKIASPGIGTGFSRYDTVHITGFAQAAAGTMADSLNADSILWDAGSDYVVVSGLAEKTFVQTAAQGTVTLERRVPDLDYLTQQDNRVWGCSSADHTIYACRQGDATNWFSYMGTAADSYAVTVGSDGDFTGAASCMGYVLLFKQGCIHKVYGTKPANYQITTLRCAGVQQSAAATLTLAQGSLYYLSGEGVMRYDGGLPEAVGEKLGPARWTAGCGGSAGSLLYLALTGADKTKHLFVWDTARRMWHREDGLDVKWFAQDGMTLYALTADGGLWAMGSEDDPYAGHDGREKQVVWQAQTGTIGLYDTNNRFVSRILLRLSGEKGSTVQVFASWDGGDWQLLARRRLDNAQRMLLPILPRRCSQMRLKLTGTGDVKLYSISKVQQQGSDL